MENAGPRPPGWEPSESFRAHQVPDARFAKAYEALGDRNRAELKRLIAAHFTLTPPNAQAGLLTREAFSCGLVRLRARSPRPLAVILCDASLDAPALLLGALLPALTSGAQEVLVLRLGSRASIPNAFLAACELAGQERVLAVTPPQAAVLLAELAAASLPAVVLHPETAPLRRLLDGQALRGLRADSPLRFAGLALPARAALWRDAPGQFAPERLALLFGGLHFEEGGAPAAGRRRSPVTDAAFAAFAAPRRDLLLVPDARATACQGQAGLTVAESLLGLWTWPELSAELSPELFARTFTAFAAGC